MSGVDILWDETSPPGPESVGLGAARIRSLKTSVRNALDAEHHFPSSSSTAGAHRLGSARAFYGTQSQVSSADTTGRLMVTSNTSRLMGVSHASAASALMLGAGPLTPSFGSWLPVSFGTVPQTKGIAMESGITKQSGAGLPGGATIDVTFPTAFDSPPFVFFQTGRAGDGYLTSHVHFNCAIITASGFTGAMVEDANGGGVAGHSNSTLWWLAIGTRNL